MEDKLTIENLQKLGFKEADVNDLYNTIDTYTLQCNEGNIFVSKTENKLYTGIDFHRKIYLNNGSLRFPNNCPDLVNEYFDLALAEFLEKQKTVLGLLYNEGDQFNKFKLNEIERSQKRMEGQKEFISKQKHFKFESKENDIQICESYINYLNNKLFLTEKPNTKKPEPTFFDFINNVDDKEAFAEDLKKTFNIEKSIDFKIMIELLKEEAIFSYTNFRQFHKCIEVYFQREIGGYSSMNDKYKHKPHDKIVHDDRITQINKKIELIVKNYKSKQIK